MKQKTVFLSEEADAWYGRNREALAKKLTDPQDDKVQHVLAKAGLAPQHVLEVGCSNGWRLRQMAERFGCACSGVEPSVTAVAEAKAAAPGMDIRVGAADSLPFADAAFDMLIYGFCLYLCDRSDLFRILAEGDRVLAEGGHVVIYDFNTDTPYRNPYAHLPGLYAYKMDYARLFTANPAYTQVVQVLMGTNGEEHPDMDNRLGITILKKDSVAAFPDNPFRK
ncbi:MAG: class I SAM-dependent methyltransferase [Proteobacteria bacterium]|nr:class I SAM-dependent methyltransferase [Pseudomonadota bacterium]